MTPADIAALRGLCEAASPGPWKPSVWIETDGDEWRATGPGHDQHAHDYGSEPGGPDEQAAQRDAAFIAAARSALPALLDRCEAAERLLPRCSGTWLAGSGGHRKYAHDCARPGIWDIGGQYVCDEHKHSKGDADAWQWHKERDLLVEMAGGDSAEIAAERVLLLAADRDRLAAECERLRALVNRAADSLDYCVQRHGEHSKSVRGDELRAAAKEGLT